MQLLNDEKNHLWKWMLYSHETNAQKKSYWLIASYYNPLICSIGLLQVALETILGNFVFRAKMIFLMRRKYRKGMQSVPLLTPCKKKQ